MLGTDKRVVYRKYEDKWIEVSFDSLKKADTFKMYEPYDLNNPVVDKNGISIFVARTDAVNGMVQI